MSGDLESFVGLLHSYSTSRSNSSPFVLNTLKASTGILGHNSLDVTQPYILVAESQIYGYHVPFDLLKWGRLELYFPAHAPENY